MYKTGRGFEYWRKISQMWVKQKSRKIYLYYPRSGNWCKTKSSMKTWMRLKEMRSCLLREFARNSKDITKQWSIRMLRRTCWLHTKLWDAIWVWKSTFLIPTRIFFQTLLAKSVTNTVKDFTKIIGYAKVLPNKWTSKTLADYSWILKRNIPKVNYRRKA